MSHLVPLVGIWYLKMLYSVEDKVIETTVTAQN